MGQAAYDQSQGPSVLRRPHFGSDHAAAPEFLVESRGRTLPGPKGSGDGALPEYVPKPSTSTPGEAV